MRRCEVDAAHLDGDADIAVRVSCGLYVPMNVRGAAIAHVEYIRVLSLSIYTHPFNVHVNA